MTNKNEEVLIYLMKKMKKSELQSRFIFMLGAGFSNHVYNVKMWSGIIEDYLNKQEIKLTDDELNELTSFEKQLILDHSEQKEKYYTKKLNLDQNKKLTRLGFKKFYKTLTSNKNIITNFYTTNHCKSIQEYFNINNTYNFDIKTINKEKETFEKKYNKNEIILNVHGTIGSKNPVVTSDQYHDFFKNGYKKLFDILKIINKKSSAQSEHNIIFIFGSSLDEKHLITFLKFIYIDGTRNIFYVGHRVINEEILNIFSEQGFNYISTCISKEVNKQCTNECNDNFFHKLNNEIKELYKPNPQSLIDFQTNKTDEIISKIISIENYIFDDTFKGIDAIIEESKENYEYSLQTTHIEYYFLWVFLTKERNIEENSKPSNLYLYYFEKNNGDWEGILNHYSHFENNKNYFILFIKRILKDNKLNLKKLLRESYLISGLDNIINILNNIFSDHEDPELFTMIYNFYKQNKKDISLLAPSSNQLIDSLKNFEISSTYKEVKSLFKFKKYNGNDGEYAQFEENLFLIIFILKFFSFNEKCLIKIIESLFIDMDMIKKITFNDQGFKESNTIDLYITNYEFIKYIFPLYIPVKNIHIAPIKSFDPKNNFNSKNANFLLNYYYQINSDEEIIKKHFMNIELSSKIGKIRRSNVGYSTSCSVQEEILEQYDKKWKRYNYKEVIEEIITDFKKINFIEHSDEKRRYLINLINKKLENKDWKTKLIEILDSFIKMEIIVKDKFWSDWNFLPKIIIKKYIDEKTIISLLSMDTFFKSYILEKYSSSKSFYVSFLGLINLNQIKEEDFSKLNKIKSKWIFEQFFKLLNVDGGRIFHMFALVREHSNNEQYDLFSIWKKIFKNKKNGTDLIDRIIESNSQTNLKYKNNLSKVLNEIFVSSEINVYKKAAYFLFDYYYYEEVEKKDSRWTFVGKDFKELNNFIQEMSYNGYEGVVDSESSIRIKHHYKRLFFLSHYDKTGLLYKFVFSNKKEVLKSERIDFIMSEIKLIYKKFYSYDKGNFNTIMKDNDLYYMFKLLINMSGYQLVETDKEMIKNMHIFYKRKEFKPEVNFDLSNLISSFINDIQFSNLAQKDMEKEVWTFKFCLLELTKEQFEKEVNKNHYSLISANDTKLKILKIFDQIKCEYHK